MEIVSLITGPIEVNTYIVFGREPGKCFIVDPSDTETVDAELEKRALCPTHILLTHGHFDHILAVAELKAKYGAEVAIHAAEADALSNSRVNLSIMSGFSVKPCKPDILLHGGETLSCAGFEIKVLHTPGHSKGSVCYVLDAERALFSGDTLFFMSVGRSDLRGGDPHELYDSIAYCLFRLEGDYRVYPGHMSKTTLQYERQNNPFINGEGPGTW